MSPLWFKSSTTPYCYRPQHTNGRLLIGAWLLLVGFPIGLARAQATDPAADYVRIQEGVSKLSPMIGTWQAVALFHDGDKISKNDGTYKINWSLERTYLECRVELHGKNDSSRRHSLLTYITYNPASRSYQSTYFYSRWALQVSETGEYDDSRHEFRTKAFIPREDGIHDQTIRTITDLSDPTKIVYTHFSHYSNESVERMDVQITLTRIAATRKCHGRANTL